MSTDHEKEQGLTARIIDKHIRRIVADAVWKGYPPSCYNGRVLDADGLSLVVHVPSAGSKGLTALYQEDTYRRTGKDISDDPSFIAPAKSALIQLQALTDEMPPILSCAGKLSLDNLKKLRQLIQDAIHVQAHIFEMPYDLENPLSPREAAGTQSLHMVIPGPGNMVDLEVAIEAYSSRTSGDGTIRSMEEVYSIQRALSFLSAMDENALLVREWGKSIVFKKAGSYDLPRLEKARTEVLAEDYWREALGDISLLTVKQQHELIKNTVAYFETLPEKLIELETGPVKVCLMARRGDADNATATFFDHTVILHQLKAGKFQAWDKVLPTIAATLGSYAMAEQVGRSTCFADFPIFVCLPNPSDAEPPVVAEANKTKKTFAADIMAFKFFSLLRDRLAGGSRGEEAATVLQEYPIHDLRIPEEYALRAISVITGKLKEAMSTGNNASLFRIMQGEVIKKGTTKKTLPPAATTVSAAARKIARTLEVKLADLLPLVEARGHMNFDIPFDYCGSLNRVCGRVTNYNPLHTPPALTDLTIQFGIVTIRLFNATKQESITKRLLADSDISQYITDVTSGTRVAESFCPSLRYALEKPEEYISALSKSVDRYVQQKRNSLLSVKEQYYSALREYFPEDMFEEYCSVGSSTPGM